MRQNLRHACARLCPPVFFLGFLLLGLRLAGDYGLYVDEFTNHYFGVTWFNYTRAIIVDHAPLAPLANATEHDVIHGPVFEVALAFIEQAVPRLADIRQIVFFRHYATWTVFYLGVVCFYFLALRLFASRALALLASLCLVLHPRIFSHSFYDSVDLPFLALYIASLHTLVRYLDRRTVTALCLHAVTCALLVDIRSMGAVIPALTLFILAVPLLSPNESARPLRRRLGRIGLFLAVVTFVTILCWPYLWSDPFHRTLDVIRQTPKVAWAGLVLYLGREIVATELPWHYLPVWILITTPIAYSVFFFVGLLGQLYALARHPVAFCRDRRNEGVMLAAFALPLLAVILLKAVVYDAWRHLFFIYPAFVLIAIAGLRTTVAGIEARLKGRASLVARAGLAVVCALNLAAVVWFMVENHPYQNVYFNRLAGRDGAEIKRRFEMDYWGLSYRAALEYVLAHDRATPVRIFHGNNALLAINSFILPPAEKARIESVDFDEAEYVFTNYRQVRAGYPALAEHFAIKVDGENILCVYRKEPRAKAPSPPPKS